MPENNIWSTPTDFPDIINPAENGFSVDVFCYCPRADTHAIGWFDYVLMEWKFALNEDFKEFVWRYFDRETDYP